MNIAVITAGGMGERFGANIPKQFLKVLDKPVLAYTLEAFESHPEIDAIEVVCAKLYMDYVDEIKRKYNLSKVRWIVESGDTYLESVVKGVHGLEDKISDDDIIIVHYGVSPFVSDEIISDSIKVCKQKGNATSAIDFYMLPGKKSMTNSVSDEGNYAQGYFKRSEIANMGCPHSFRYRYVKNLFDKATETGAMEITESNTVALMAIMNEPMYFSKGSQTNIKITTSEDLAMFEGWVLMKERRAKLGFTAEDVLE